MKFFCINTTMKINLLPPALIFYTPRFKRKDWQAAIAKGPLVFIRPEYKDDEALLNHELFHVLQWWITLGTHPLLYTFVSKYRYWSEIYAYRRQLRKYPENIDLYAGYIADHYNLNVTKEQAKRHLES